MATFRGSKGAANDKMLRGTLLQIRVGALLLVLTVVGTVPVGWSQIFVTRIDLNRVEAYHLDGSNLSTNLITGLNSPYGIAVSGTNLFVANDSTGTIGKYNLDGTVVNTTLISGLSNPRGLAVYGTSLFVAEGTSRRIGEYSLDGTVINASRVNLAAGHVPYGVDVSAAGIFVVDQDTGGGLGIRVGAYNLDGTARIESLVAGLSGAKDVTVSGTRLFVAENTMNRVGEYNAVDGSTIIAARISPVDGAEAVAISGGKLYFVATTFGTIGEYNLDGSGVTLALISGVPGALGIAVFTAIPEPTTYAALFGLAAFGFAAYRRRRQLN